MAMRAHVANKVTSSFRKKRSSPSHNHDREREQEANQTADQEVEETARFWAEVQKRMDSERAGNTTPKLERRETNRVKRRPSLQLSETLRGLKPHWVVVPQPLHDIIDKVPVINPNSGRKVSGRDGVVVVCPCFL